MDIQKTANQIIKKAEDQEALGNQPIDKPKPPENMLDGYPIKFWQQACVIIGDRGNKFMNMRHNLINPDLLDAVMEYFKNQSESKQLFRLYYSCLYTSWENSLAICFDCTLFAPWKSC